MRENGEGARGGWKSYQAVMQVWPQEKETGKEGRLAGCMLDYNAVPGKVQLGH